VLDRPRGEQASFLHELGLEACSVLVEPFAITEGQGVGLAIALRRDGSFGKRERTALAELADAVAARLTAERLVEIERLRHGMQARERERTRWAREIHDESIQGLGALRMRLANARDLEDTDALAAAVEEALEGLGNEIDGLRHLITELRPAALDDLGLGAALQALARRAQAIDGLDVTAEITFAKAETGGAGNAVAAGGRLDSELESTIYRVVQEALTNVSRHAEARRATIHLSADADTVVATVTDDGRGMPDTARLGPREDGGGFGTGGRLERAELVGGAVEWLPAPGRGTIVRLTVPLAARRSREAATYPAA
jgi:two-component system, NarL family, sensor histidine kinase DevS